MPTKTQSASQPTQHSDSPATKAARMPDNRTGCGFLVAITLLLAACILLFIVGFEIFVPNQKDPVSAISVVIAGEALLVGLITLASVFQQIILANEQLALARNELAAVEQDLRFSAEQSRYINRRALLGIFSTSPLMTTTSFYPTVSLDLSVCNLGTKLAKSFRIEIEVPLGLMLKGVSTLDKSVPTRDVRDRAGLRVVSFHIEQYVYPQESVHCVSLEFESNPCGTYGLRWRVLFEDGIVPSSGNFLSLASRADISDLQPQG